MSRYEMLFDRLSSKKEGVFIPFVTLGDPNFEQSLQIIECLIEAGADALELGIPFSDPMADGPTIQNANLRAFAADITPKKCFELIAKIRKKHPEVPIGLLMYANLVFSNGIESFYKQAKQAGVDSVLIADVPIEEAEPFYTAAKKYDIAPIFICPPNANDALIQKIAELGEAYTYLLSRAGVTGAENQSHQPLEHLITALKKHRAPPAIQGFGIAEPKQFTESLNSGAAGVISGSAVVNIIEKHCQSSEVMLKKLTEFVKEMKAVS